MVNIFFRFMSIWVPFERAHQTELFYVFFKIKCITPGNILAPKEPKTGYFGHKINPMTKIRIESKKFRQNKIILNQS